jgi:hypothetical protein
MTWPSDGLSSPSMASPSIPGSTPRITSTTHTTSPNVPADKKRKNGVQDQGRTPAQKRLKSMGRPRNGWTPTRKRKLVRLYLMTELNVGEIAEVLRAKHFQPWYVLQDVNSVLLLTNSLQQTRHSNAIKYPLAKPSK